MPSRYVPTKPQTPAPADAAPQDVSFPWKAAALVTRLLGGLGSGITSVEPGLGTALAAGIGGGAETLAQKLETPSGTPVDKKRIAVEAALSAVPLGKIYQGGKLGMNIVRGAGLAEVGNLARRKAATGDYLPHDASEAMWDAANVGLGGAVGVIPGMAGKVKPVVPNSIEEAVQKATSHAPTGGVSDVGMNGLRVGPETPRVVKRGGVSVRPGEPEVPKVTEVKSSVRAAMVPKKSSIETRSSSIPLKDIENLNDIDAATKMSQDVSKAERGVNETARKAETKLIGKEQIADLQDIKAQQQAGASVQTTLPRLLKKSAVPGEVTDLNKAIKAEQSVAAKARAASGRTEAQGVRQEAGADAQNLTRVNREAVAAQKALDNEANLRAIEAAKADRIPTSPSISESVSAKTGEGQRTSMSRRFVEPAPPEGEGGGPGVSLTGDIPDVSPDVAQHTNYGNKDAARDAAIKHGAKDVVKIGRGKYRLVFGDERPGISPADPTLTPTPTPTPKGPKTPPAAPAAEMAPGLDRDVIVGTPYTNKTEAAAIAKATGGTVHQQGPRSYRVKFTEEAVIPTERPTSATPKDLPVFNDTPTINTAKTKPLAEPVPGDNGLTDAEHKRYIDVSPQMGTKRTPAEMAEYVALQEKINAKTKPWVNPNSEAGKKLAAEVSDFTGGQPVHGLEIPVPEALSEVTPESVAAAKAAAAVERSAAEKLTPGKTITPEGKITPANVIDVGKQPLAVEPTPTMQDLADVANKPGPQIAKVNFPTSKLPGKSQLPDEIQGSLLSGSETPVPETPQGGVIPARMFKNRVDAAGQAYGDIKQAKLAGEKVPEEGRAIAGKNAAMEARAAAKAKAPIVPGTSELTSDDLTKMTPEAQSKALTDLVKKFKGESGTVNPMLLARVAGAGLGAAVGAANDKDDPLTGALLGGTAGAFAPSVVRALIGHASTSDLPESSIRAIADKAKDTVDTAFRMMPDYQRFALLSRPVNLAMNMWVGPWGSAIMASLEHAIRLDPKGIEGLKYFLNPKNFPKDFAAAIPEAGTLIHSAEERTEGAMGSAGPAWFRTATAWPGVGMTAGDVGARNGLMHVGFTSEEARAITLTSEPYSAFGAGISKMKKGAKTLGGKRSWAVDMALPFYRTNVNQIEQSLDRTPFLGLWWNKYAKDIPDEMNVVIAKQVMGGSVTGASFALGLITPPDENRYTVKFINNFGGQYGKLASTAFVMGQAMQQGKDPVGALQQTIVQDVPLPSTDLLQNIFTDYKAIRDRNPEKFKSPFPILPGVLDPKVPGSLPQLVGGGLALGGASSPAKSPTQSRSRYVPTRPRK